MVGKSPRPPWMEENCRESQDSAWVVALIKKKKKMCHCVITDRCHQLQVTRRNCGHIEHTLTQKNLHRCVCKMYEGCSRQAAYIFFIINFHMLNHCAPPSRSRVSVEVCNRQGAWLISSRTGLANQVCNMLSLTANRTGLTHQVCLPQVFTHVTSTKHTTCWTQHATRMTD